MKINRVDLLVALYIFCIAVSELMGGKTFPVANIFGFQLNSSVAIFTVPLMFTAIDVISEVYGRERARSLVWSGVIVIALLLLFALLATSLPPSVRSIKTEAAYDTIFGTTARIAAASLTAFFIASILDVLVFSRIRERMHNQALWLRNNASNFVSAFFDSFIFVWLAFYAFNLSFAANAAFLMGIVIPYWLLRCLMSVIETPIVYGGVKWLRGEKAGEASYEKVSEKAEKAAPIKAKTA